MRILLTNDDGIHAPGLVVLQDIARTLSDDVWVVAPELDQSGASHAITLRAPLRMRELSPKVHAVTGTPTDCVIMGVRHLLRDQVPTLVLSGVNRGANMAEDVTYSGTIAGAMEGTLLGIRSIALSLATGFGESRDPKWETALAHGPSIIQRLLDGPWQPGTLMNVNFPDRLPEEVGPIEVTRQGRRDQEVLQIDARVCPQEVQSAAGNGSVSRLRRPHFGDAAGARSHPPCRPGTTGASPQKRGVIPRSRQVDFYGRFGELTTSRTSLLSIFVSKTIKIIHQSVDCPCAV